MTDLLVRNLQRFAEFDVGERQVVEEAFASRRSFEAACQVTGEGEPAASLHAVVSGWACRYKLLPDERRQILGLMLPGDVCDLDRLGSERIDSGVATLTSCTLALAPRERVLALIEERPAIRRAFRGAVLADNALADERNLCLGRRSALERLAHFLCELDARLSARDAAHDHSYTLPLTQEHLSDALGLSIVHINRTMQALRREGLVTLEGRRLTIRDWRGLTRLAGFDPRYLHLGTADAQPHGATPRAAKPAWREAGAVQIA